MKELNRKNAGLKDTLPIRILQFGEGNFLRAFADWMIDQMNEKAGYNSGICVVQPIDMGMTHLLTQQDGLYYHLLRGLSKGKVVNEARLISSIQESFNPFERTERYFELAENEELKLILSNTTEAGIQFDSNDRPKNGELAKTFPGKLTQLLYKRFQFFDGDPERGLAIIPCELIESNGEKLREAVLKYDELWELSDGFEEWIKKSNSFANTLVDRIVPGYPKEEIEDIKKEIGYDDKLVVASEAFHLWVIEGDQRIQRAFPADKQGFNVKYVKSIVPYRIRKVRILNGAHTSMVPVGLLSGIETVREAVEDEKVGSFIKNTIFNEIIPTIDLPENELNEFAEEVLERFRNPFIRHELITISLNSISKYKVRVLPTVLDNLAKGKVPSHLLFSLSCLIKFYMSGDFEIKDTPEYLEFFESVKQRKVSDSAVVELVLGNHSFWDKDLTQLPGIKEKVTGFYEALNQKSISEVIKII